MGERDTQTHTRKRRESFNYMNNVGGGDDLITWEVRGLISIVHPLILPT